MGLVPVVNDMVPVIGWVSAEVELSEIVLPARDGVSAAAETNMVRIRLTRVEGSWPQCKSIAEIRYHARRKAW